MADLGWPVLIVPRGTFPDSCCLTSDGVLLLLGLLLVSGLVDRLVSTRRKRAKAVATCHGGWFDVGGGADGEGEGEGEGGGSVMVD